MAVAREQTLFPASLVDMCHVASLHGKAQTKVFGSQHIVQIGHEIGGGRLSQLLVQAFQSANPFIGCQVYSYEADIPRELSE